MFVHATNFQDPVARQTQVMTYRKIKFQMRNHITAWRLANPPVPFVICPSLTLAPSCWHCLSRAASHFLACQAHWAQQMDRACVAFVAVSVLLIALYGAAVSGNNDRPWHPAHAARRLAELAAEVRVGITAKLAAS